MHQLYKAATKNREEKKESGKSKKQAQIISTQIRREQAAANVGGDNPPIP